MTEKDKSTGFLREASIPDLAWLVVDPEEYRKNDHLPKQNLDMVPDLEALWSHDDKPASNYVPNKGRPKSMLEVGLEGKISKQAQETKAELSKTARYALMRSDDLRVFKAEVFSKFDRQSIQAHREVLASVLEERGLLGRYYIAAEDFPDCQRGTKAPSDFTSKYASRAPYVIAKSACSNCVRATEGRCGVFQKKIIVEVPYSELDASRVERKEASRGKTVQASLGTPPKERIRLALLAKTERLEAPESIKPVENMARNLRATEEAPKRVSLPMLAQERKEVLARETSIDLTSLASGKTASSKVGFDRKALEIKALLQSEMLRGKGERDLVSALKLSFSSQDLQETRSVWEPMFREAGHFGTVYVNQDSFDSCKEGSDFLAAYNPKVKAVVASDRCSGCAHNQVGHCASYGLPLVASKEEVFTSAVVKKVVWEHRQAGRLDKAAAGWGSNPEKDLKEIYRAAEPVRAEAPKRATIQTASVSTAPEYRTPTLVKEKIVRTASQLLNAGLCGAELAASIRQRFEVRDLKSVQEPLKLVLAEQGLQGFHYIDPTVYADYGKGCREAESLHRTSSVKYAKSGSSCENCLNHIKKGFCSKLAKTLVAEPYYTDKAAQQKAVLASKKPQVTVVEDKGRRMLAEYQLSSKLSIDIAPKAETAKFEIELGQGVFKL